MKPFIQRRLLLLFLAMVACGSNGAQSWTPIDAASQISPPPQADSACAKLSDPIKESCDDSLKRMRIQFNLAVLAHRNTLATLEKQGKARTARLNVAQKACSPSNKKSCDVAKIIKAELDLIEDRKKAESERHAKAEARYGKAAKELPVLLQEYKPAAKVICKLRDDGRVVCVPMSAVLASYDEAYNTVILQDMAALYQRFRIGAGREVLIKCMDGSWGSATLDDFSASSPPDFLQNLTEGSVSLLQQVCLDAGSSSSGNSGTGSGGSFSGVTGLDPLGRGSVCGMDATASSGGVKYFIEQFEKMTESFDRKCKTSLRDTMSEGEDAGSSDDSTDASSGGSISNDSTTDNGDGTETVCHNDQCYVRYKAGTSQGTNPQKVCSSDGTCRTQVSGLDNDNKPITVSETQESDGTKWYSIRRHDGSLEIYGIEAPDGSRFMMICKGGHCRESAAKPGEDLPDPLEPTYQDLKDFEEWLRSKQHIDIGDCIDESCGTCGEAYSFMTELKKDCISSGGKSPSCAQTMRDAGCCSNAKAFPADPRIIMPNPNGSGNFACSVDVSTDAKKDACKKKCSVASDQDCTEVCEAGRRATFEFDLLDAICTRAISDECVSRKGIPMPGFAGASGRRPTPLPVPEAITRHLLFQVGQGSGRPPR